MPAVLALIAFTTAGQVAATSSGASRLPSDQSSLSAKPSEAASNGNAHEAAVTACLQMWDRGTHMTRREWSRTCRRVQDHLRRLELR